MKLLTHNMLTSTIIKGVQKGYPLGIQARDVKVVEAEYNEEFIKRMLTRIDWPALCQAADCVGHLGDLPREVAEDMKKDGDFLKKVHHVLMEVEVKEGDLVCPETGRKFPIKEGIPNMLLNEDEV